MRGAARRTVRWLLDFPIFWKILIANSLVVVAGAVAATLLRLLVSEASTPLLAADFATVGVAAVVLNFIILKAALLPLSSVEQAVGGLAQGRLGVRAERRLLGDPAINRLIDTLNATLDDLDASLRQRRELASRILLAQEEERRRISRELHDETGQALTSLAVGLKALENRSADAEVRAAAAALRAQASRTLEGVRRLSVELRPAALDELGLVPALHSYAREYERRHGIAVGFAVEGIQRRLPDTVELALYRVVQESLTNVARHACAAHVFVTLEAADGRVWATVEDDGKGLDVERARRARRDGLGLFGMQERMASLGGDLRIEGAEGAGTRIVASAPVAAFRTPR